MSTPLAFTGLARPDVGGDRDNWGNILNALLEFMDRQASGFISLDVTGIGATRTLTATEAEHRVLRLTGDLTENLEVVLPALSRLYFVRNETQSLDFDITFRVDGGTKTEPVTRRTMMAIFADNLEACQASPPVAIDPDCSGFPDTIRHPGKTYDGPGISFSDRITGLARRAAGVLGLHVADDGLDRVRIHEANTVENPQLAIADPFGNSFGQGFYIPEQGNLGIVNGSQEVARFAAGLRLAGASGGDPGQGNINVQQLWVNGSAYLQVAGEVFATYSVGSRRYNRTHNFNITPRVRATLECITAEFGYSVGEEITIGSMQSDADANQGVVFSATPTTVHIIQMQSLIIPDKASPATIRNPTGGRWRYKLYLDA